MKKLLLFSVLLFGVTKLGWMQTVFYSENVGNPSSTTGVSIYTGWQNSSPIIYSGDADVRLTTTSNGYDGASGNGNVFITNVVGRYLLISGINSSAYNNISLSLGHYKSTTAGNNELVIEVSSDGINFNALNYSRPTGTELLPGHQSHQQVQYPQHLIYI